MATLSEVAANPPTRWQHLTVALGYGAVNRTIAMASATAVWFHPGMPPVAGRGVLIRDPDNRLKTQTRLCPHLNPEATALVQWGVQRWRLEVTVEAVRAHLGMETQRQWSKPAIARTTPILRALCSLVTLIAPRLVTT